MSDSISASTWAKILSNGRFPDSPSLALRFCLLDRLVRENYVESGSGRVISELLESFDLIASDQFKKQLNQAIGRLRTLGIVTTVARPNAGIFEIALLRPPNSLQIAELSGLLHNARKLLAQANAEMIEEAAIISAVLSRMSVADVALAAAETEAKKLARRQTFNPGYPPPRPKPAAEQHPRPGAAPARRAGRRLFKASDAVPEGGSQVSPRIAEILARYEIK